METLQEKIHKLIEDNLPIKEKEKSDLGEVFTPISMIETLYARFPKSIWKNQSYTWLDPAGGIGNFPIVLFFWLMNGLSSIIPNSAKRAKHIIENMIYIVEINKENVKTCVKIFKEICPDAKPNICEQDFLKFDPVALKWPKTFDCIIGNPPYNIGGTGLEGSKRTHIIFTEVALKLLSPKGYLAYICPPSYRETNTPMNDLFKESKGHFVFIKIYGAQETHKLFRIQGRVDGFIYQKDVAGKTIIDDEYGIVEDGITIDLDRHIPNFGFSIFEKLYTKVDKLGNVKAFRNTELSSVKASTFGCNGRNKILHLIIEKGKRVYKTTKKHSLASKPKLLINGLGVPYVYYDKSGEYAPSQTPVIILNPSRNLVNLVQSVVFSFIAWGLRLTGNNNLPYLFNAIPDISKEANKYSTLAEIKQGLGLTEKEINFITEHFHKYEYQDKDIIEKCAKNVTRKKK
jgi:hypothetical protein